ncbi:MAG TPA: hypothetical protein VKQ32_01440, partial [Polyangia bacterium]|nr:hypothetical protein [Polyangia bacterium]
MAVEVSKSARIAVSGPGFDRPETATEMSRSDARRRPPIGVTARLESAGTAGRDIAPADRMKHLIAAGVGV